MSSLPNGKSMCPKLVELFAYRVIERRNMINDYLRGRDCIESVRGELILGGVNFELLCWFWVFLTLLYHFAWLYRFSCLLLAFAVFLLLDDLLSFFWLFGSSSCASCGLGFELQTLYFYCQWTHQWGDWETKWLVPWLDCDESLTWRSLNSNPGQLILFFFYRCFVWRIVFACLVVCRWQVRHGGSW
jgi:hypothetical protein